ncbi:4'-phosphopantetheinyl transferase superfamily protein [Paenibacillus sp. HN-1]|nr:MULTISPECIES: 4'-phosphopantetheinyl transferase superfamily protein [Paenibacillus]MBY9079507.1 4'-phosphopantetheinyl transferase superfamily protein [Paenibacillus sp. CGMCC 1.18879]MBY9085596.1 4'-phosphopantetheinyl transferase superfamily protein [Paenibacillus sinensis]
MRREQVGRFVRKEDAYRSLLGECLVRKAARSQLGLANKDITFVKNKYGKPSLHGVDSFFFNVSHSGDWVVLFWGRGEVGVDVEQVKTIDLGIAERFFSPVEYADLLDRSVEERSAYFFDLWTLKESYIKTVGTGLSTPLDSFSIRVLPGGEISVTPNEKGFRFKQYELSPCYKMSACTCGTEFPETVIQLDVADLL